MDEFEAAAKRHKLREAAKAEKKDRRMKEKYGTIDFKEEKADDQPLNPDDVIENSYDSEFEAEFFGVKNKELNAKADEILQGEASSGSDSDDQIDSKTKKQEKFDTNDFKDELVSDVNKDLQKL